MLCRNNKRLGAGHIQALGSFLPGLTKGGSCCLIISDRNQKKHLVT
jgi:hypothetical protein